MNFLRTHSRYLLFTLALAALGCVLCAVLCPMENRTVADQLVGFPDSDLPSNQARPFVLAALCFLPMLAAFAYALGGTLDRYIVREFLGIFAICLCGLLMIWLLIDLGDNLSDFTGSPHVLKTIGIFYGARFPAILLLLVPYSLLLSLLYSLGKLSTHQEIVPMIQAGRGIPRIALPLLIAGGFCTLLSLGLNYQWAPIAEGRQNEILAEATGKQASVASQVLYLNPDEHRLWMIGKFPPDYQNGRPLLNVEVTTTHADQSLASRLVAAKATWNRASRKWTFEDAVVGRYKPGAPPEFVKPDGPLTIDHWTETPWQLIKPGLSARYLGIPGLTTWLRENLAHPQFADRSPYITQWHYRWALPFTCLVTVLLATPLAIYFSRRGPGGGVFLAVVLSALMLLTTNIVLAFGSAGTLHPALAAWLPNLAFTALGLYLFRRRITGRPIYHSLMHLLRAED